MEAEKRRIQAFFRQVAQTRRVTLRITENDLYRLRTGPGHGQHVGE
jgi:hypothetical protein